jgi:uncharacterized protein (DUF1800 family)
MLEYLDQTSSACNMSSTPNENYAREIMELHILGTEPQVYDEDDVRDLSMMLSGWSQDIVLGSGGVMNLNFTNFLFIPANHCPPATPYDFFGQMIPGDANTPAEGRAAIDALIDYDDPPPPLGIDAGRVCPQFIALKLVRTFLTDAPLTGVTPAQLAAMRRALDDAAAAFGTNGDITAMLQAILTEANITDVLTGPNPLYKYMPPWLFVTSLLRASEAAIDPNQIAGVTDRLKQLGQEPYAFPPPIGYPEDIGAWVQDQPGRWHFAYDLFENNTGSITGVTVDVYALYDKLGAGGSGGMFTPSIAGQQADLILTGGNMSAEDRQIIQRYANIRINQGAPHSEVQWKVLVLAALAPSVNRY